MDRVASHLSGRYCQNSFFFAETPTVMFETRVKRGIFFFLSELSMQILAGNGVWALHVFSFTLSSYSEHFSELRALALFKAPENLAIYPELFIAQSKQYRSPLLNLIQLASRHIRIPLLTFLGHNAV